MFLKRPERIEALIMVMTLCLMVYSFAQYFLRDALAKSNETLPNQLKNQLKNLACLGCLECFMAYIY